MAHRILRLVGDVDADIVAGLNRIRDRHSVPEAFDPAALAEAAAAVDRAAVDGALVDGVVVDGALVDGALVDGAGVDGNAGTPPAEGRARRAHAVDRTDLPLITIDPVGSTDLDQAVYLERAGAGYLVWYAIADVAAFVRPGGHVDAEAHRRVETLYGPDRRTPLHPEVLSEGAASLLPGRTRPALLWRLELDAGGEGVAVEVRHAVVRSRAQLSYDQAQAALDAGTADGTLRLLREVGLLRQERERARGGVSLPIPEQEIVRDEDGWDLRFRAPLAIEGWNAQISLLTGMAAAWLMVRGRVGVLRTLPAADPRELNRLRRSARALDVPWAAGLGYPEFVRSLDPTNPRHAALLSDATAVLRGAGYTAFNGSLPEQREHAALAQEYAHCTAPLRRLVDRYVGETCVALCAGQAPPAWVLAALDGLPATMTGGARRAAAFDRDCLNLVEAALLTGLEGHEFPGVIVDRADGKPYGTVQVSQPAVRGRVDGSELPLGEFVRVRLATASVEKAEVRFVLA